MLKHGQNTEYKIVFSSKQYKNQKLEPEVIDSYKLPMYNKQEVKLLFLDSIIVFFGSLSTDNRKLQKILQKGRKRNDIW